MPAIVLVSALVSPPAAKKQPAPMNPTQTRVKAAKGPSARNAQMPPSTATLTDSASNSDMVVSPVDWLLRAPNAFPVRKAPAEDVSRKPASLRLISKPRVESSILQVRRAGFLSPDNRLSSDHRSRMSTCVAAQHQKYLAGAGVSRSPTRSGQRSAQFYRWAIGSRV